MLFVGVCGGLGLLVVVVVAMLYAGGCGGGRLLLNWYLGAASTSSQGTMWC